MARTERRERRDDWTPPPTCPRGLAFERERERRALPPPPRRRLIAGEEYARLDAA
ncbi:hypothetical protein [Streptomyces albidoflavus]|uniref:hypothetical protein n=1 Tax=Streptomyces albidoflavus TaxID=1886 RepID=UPI0033BE3390